MECRILTEGDPLGFDASFHAADLADRLGVEAAVPHRPVDQIEEAAAELVVAGHDARPGHRLALPGEGVPPPVRVERPEAAGQGPAATLGTKVGVDVVDPLGRRGAADDAPQAGGQPLGLLGAGGTLPLVDEDEIEVAGVGQLCAPETSHADDGERDGRLERRQRRLQRGFGQSGEVVADLVDIGVAQHVSRRDAEEVALLPTAQHRLAGGPVVSHADGHRSRGDEAIPVAGGQAGRLGEAGHQVGVVAEDLADQAAGAGQEAQRSSSGGGVPEGLDPRAAHLRTGQQVADEEEPEVGVGRLRQPVEQQREQLVHEPAGAVQAAGQLLHRRLRPAGVDEAEGAEASGGRFGAQGGVAHLGRGERLQERAEVHPLVDAAHGRLLVAQLPLELLPGRSLGVITAAHHPGQAVEGGAVGREGVDLLLVLELEAVLDRAQQAVGVGQPVGVVGVHVARRRHLGQRVEGRRAPQSGVEVAVDELEELDGELDVPDAARTPLQLTVVQPLPGHLGLGPDLHGSQRPQGVGVERHRPQRLLSGGQPPGAQGAVTGDRPGLEQRLELPRLGPPLPVGPVRVDRPHERTVPTLRAQVGVHPEAGPGDLHHGARPPLQPFVVSDADEHHVDVARVVQLVAPQLPHPDDGEGHRSGPVARSVGGRRQPYRRGEDLTTEGGQGCCHRLQGVEPDEVAAGDAEELPVAPRHQLRAGAVGGLGAAIEVGQHVESVNGTGLDQPTERAAGRQHRHGRRGQRGVGAEPRDRVGRGIGQVLQRDPHPAGGGTVLDEGFEGEREPGAGHRRRLLPERSHGLWAMDPAVSTLPAPGWGEAGVAGPPRFGPWQPSGSGWPRSTRWWAT